MKQLNRPKQIEEVDLQKVRLICAHYMSYVQVERMEPEEIKDYVFMEVIKALYGEDAFEWIASQIRK